VTHLEQLKEIIDTNDRDQETAQRIGHGVKGRPLLDKK
jgi:hypothetical protein